MSAGAVRVADRSGDPIAAGARGGGASLQAAKDPAVIVSERGAEPGRRAAVGRARVHDGDGRGCVQVGRLRDGVFGQVQGGRFRALPRPRRGRARATGASGPLVAVARRASIGPHARLRPRRRPHAR